jgi:hypothetical protein
MNTQFPSDELESLNAAEEIQIEVESADGGRHEVTLWVVVDGHCVYVRSVDVPPGRWHRDLTVTCRGTVCTGNRRLPVRAVADGETQARVSCAYLRKYAHFPQDAAWIARHALEPTTLRLEFLVDQSRSNAAANR